MCCSFCEEPVRSVTLGLAALGIATLIRGGVNLWRWHVSAPSEQACCPPSSIAVTGQIP